MVLTDKAIMIKTVLPALLLTACLTVNAQTIKQTLGKYFLVGCAVNTTQMDGKQPKATDLIEKQYNAIVAENCMKPEVIAPADGMYDFRDADKLVNFGNHNDIKVIGHVLVWHEQTSPWMFAGQNGKAPSREEMLKRMHDYIYTVVGRYRGRVYGWDVVNEAFLDDGSVRESPWYKAIGYDYFYYAFKFAHEADSTAQLYYNDYNMYSKGKREAVCKLVRYLRHRGCRIDAVGMQSHIGANYPDNAEYEKTIDSLSANGVKVNISELDLNMLPNPSSFSGADINQKYAFDKKMNPYVDGLDKKAQQLFDKRYKEIFSIISRHKEHIERVNFWGVCDADSWLNNWPIKGRTSYPLLFDRNYNMKTVAIEIMNMFK